jgi:hypothetical protein
MPPLKKASFATPQVQSLEARLAPSAAPAILETFDTTATGSLPAGWSQWSSNGSTAFAVAGGLAVSAPNGLAMSAGQSSLAARSWVNALQPADVQVNAAIYLSTLIPAQVFARGNSLNTATPTYYALSLTRGLQAQLVRVSGGIVTTLATVTSALWFSDRWVQATLDVQGSTLRAQVYRPDTQQYLNAQGQWQTVPAWALQVQDAVLTGPGDVGVGRPASYTGTVTYDNFSVTLPGITEHFDQTAPGALPTGWAQWSSAGGAAFAVSSGRAVSTANELTATSAQSSIVARAWPTAFAAADVQASADVYLNSLIPAQIFARGNDLDGAAPSYYALSLTRGLKVQLQRVQSGATTVLGQLASGDWVSDTWVQVVLAVSGNQVRARVYRLESGAYLTAAGTWQAAPAWALTVTDGALTGPGAVGLARPASYAGAITFDDFAAVPASGDSEAPSVTITPPSSPLSDTILVSATASDNVGVVRVELDVDGVRRSYLTTGPYQWSLDSTTMANGTHTLAVVAYDSAGNVGLASATVTVQNAGALPQPTIPQHLPNIRIAELAYSGTPVDAAMASLLQNTVDVVITDKPSLGAQIDGLAPSTPELAYINLSNLYGSLVTDWDNWADVHGVPREAAFLHVTQPTPFSGDSVSSQPVTWFWAVYQASASSGLQDLTERAHTGSQNISLGALGTSTAIGYAEPFSQINFNLAAGAGAGWSAVLEYPTAVDADGNPTAWATLSSLSDTTGGYARSGRITFAPPSEWKTGSVNNSARMYFVRIRVVSSGTPPLASTILAADYVNAGGTTSGVIPALGSAQFAYQSRLFYSGYGQMRFATNPSNPYFRQWAIDHSQRFLAAHSYAAGLFVDNSPDTAPAPGAGLAESVAAYSVDYASLLTSVGQAVAPAWLMANTVGGGLGADPLLSHNTAYFEEAALRPLAASYQQFESLAALVAHRTTLQSPPPYAVLDALPTGGSATDPRTQMAALAEYYLLADSSRTFFDPFGGASPASSWAQHYFGAISYNIGQPAGAWSIVDSGLDPNDNRYSYRVYGRQYSNALVLYKPLSSTANDAGLGLLSSNTATSLPLYGTYRVLQADGTLGPPITSISLRNGEGAILARA